MIDAHRICCVPEYPGDVKERQYHTFRFVNCVSNASLSVNSIT